MFLSLVRETPILIYWNVYEISLSNFLQIEKMSKIYKYSQRVASSKSLS